MLLAFGAVVGVVVAVVAYFFLKGVSEAQTYVFATLPKELGFATAPVWWPLPWPALAGLLVALTIRYLPGNAGHKPAERFKINIYILGRQLRADGIRAAVFHQIQQGTSWADAPVAPNTATDLENAILTRARQMRIAGGTS